MTGWPLLVGKSVSWFPSHANAYAWFWAVGGLFGLLAYAILALLVHPQVRMIATSGRFGGGLAHSGSPFSGTHLRSHANAQEEPLDRSCQCTRERYHSRERDDVRRRRKQAEDAEVAEARAASGGLRRRRVGGEVPLGAQLCDQLLFGEQLRGSE